MFWARPTGRAIRSSPAPIGLGRPLLSLVRAHPSASWVLPTGQLAQAYRNLTISTIWVETNGERPDLAYPFIKQQGHDRIFPPFLHVCHTTHMRDPTRQHAENRPARSRRPALRSHRPHPLLGSRRQLHPSPFRRWCLPVGLPHLARIGSPTGVISSLCAHSPFLHHQHSLPGALRAGWGRIRTAGGRCPTNRVFE